MYFIENKSNSFFFSLFHATLIITQLSLRFNFFLISLTGKPTQISTNEGLLHRVKKSSIVNIDVENPIPEKPQISPVVGTHWWRVDLKYIYCISGVNLHNKIAGN